MIEKEVIEKVRHQIFEDTPPVLQTGFRDLDMLLNKTEKGSLITVGARPSMGKTSFLTTIMLNLLERKKKCLYFSLEMSTALFIKRLVSQIGEIDTTLLYMKNTISEKPKIQEKINIALDKIGTLNLTINENAANIAEIEETIKHAKPEFVFIDYLQIIDTPKKKTRSEGIEEVMLQLKRVANENDCIIFIASQLSRALESRCCKIPMLSDLRESGAIENISDVVLFIYREEYYTSYDTDEEKYAFNKGKAEIIVAKNKYGAFGSINLLFRASIMKFLEPLEDCYEF